MDVAEFREIIIGDELRVSGNSICTVVAIRRQTPRWLGVIMQRASMESTLIEDDSSSVERAIIDPQSGNYLLPADIPTERDFNRGDTKAKNDLLGLSDETFAKFMRTIDAELQSSQVAIVGRSLQSISLICQKYGLSLAADDPLACRIDAWMKQRYDNRLNVDLAGNSLLLLQGDIYRMRLPMFIGNPLNCSNVGIPSSATNILDFIVDLPKTMRADFTLEDCIRIKTKFLRTHENWFALSRHMNEPLIKIAIGDLNSAIENALAQHPQFGLSKWASLQAVEKYIKAWLTKRNLDFPKTHNLADKLVPLAEANGLPHILSFYLSSVQCEATVRYDASTSATEAYDAYLAALEVCRLISDAY